MPRLLFKSDGDTAHPEEGDGPQQGIDGFANDLQRALPRESETRTVSRSNSQCSASDKDPALQANDSGVFSMSAYSSLNASADSLTSSGVWVAAKKKRATRQGKSIVRLVGNIFPLEVGPKIVYRYDISIFIRSTSASGQPKEDNLAKGPRDDAALCIRRGFCISILEYALEKYRILSDNQAVVYDGASILFSSQKLDDFLEPLEYELTVMPNEVPKGCREFMAGRRCGSIAVQIKPCHLSAASFDISRFAAAQSNRDQASLDRTWKQFYNMLTNQFALSRGDFTLFGAGRLFARNADRRFYSGGMEIVHGADKGIKFIEGTSNGISSVVAALTLDAKAGLFFKHQGLAQAVEELARPPPENRSGRGGRGRGRNGSVQFFDGHEKTRFWSTVNNYVKGLRLAMQGSDSESFIAFGITSDPVSRVTEIDVSGRTVSLLSSPRFLRFGNLDVHDDWPAVVIKSRNGTVHFPMELLYVVPNQRVPLNKQTDPPAAENPEKRFERTRNLLYDLNLDSSGSRNAFLRAFNVRIADRPIRIEAIKRQAPSIGFRGKHVKESTNWRMDNAQYVSPANVDLIVVAYTNTCDPYLAESALTALRKTTSDRGIIAQNWRSQFVDATLVGLGQVMKDLNTESGSGPQRRKIMLILIDDKLNKSHGILKLLERKFGIITQQLTSNIAQQLAVKSATCSNVVHKINCKLAGLNHSVLPDMFGQDIWINCPRNTTLVIGYDVAHPGAESKFSVKFNMPPETPSVVGFAFNGGAEAEAFIGDYHFQTPRKEEVEPKVLGARMRWMLRLFCQHRGLPERIIVVRDGVSEGQYRMVMENELDALREACHEYGIDCGVEDWVPKFLVVIVTKRHNVRFYQLQNAPENPPPCTVVDDVVTRNDMTEFYMQSHRVIMGTGKSPSYQVLVDELDWSMDQIQSFMLALCFNHQICDAPISLPEPVYQADRWASRGKLIWSTYCEHYNVTRLQENQGYAECPIDFEAMTKRLAFWNTALESSRINA